MKLSCKKCGTEMKEIGRVPWRVLVGIKIIYKCQSNHLFIWKEYGSLAGWGRGKWISL